eukprot:gene35522-4761_t
MPAAAGAPVSVLCLHGSRQDGEIFSQRLRQLQRRCEGRVALHYVDAPFELPCGDGDDVAMRTWWRRGADGVAASDVAAAVAAVGDAWRSAGGCDGLLGFSQGATLCGLLLLLADGGA